MPREVEIDEMASTHRRTITSRVVVTVIAMSMLALSWVVSVLFDPIIGLGLALGIVLMVVFFFWRQAREMLVVTADGLEFSRGNPVWAFAWNDCVGIELEYHWNDLGGVRFAISGGAVHKIDLNWRNRDQLEQSLVLLANQIGSVPPEHWPSTRLLGYRLGKAIRDVFQRSKN